MQNKNSGEHMVETAEVLYTPEKIYSNGVLFTGEAIEKQSPEMSERFKNLELEQVFFKVHTKEQLDFDQIKEKAHDPNCHVYVLLHGWTGTNEIFDSVHKPPKGQTIVEQILENDPAALIICPDALGFGKTKFEKMSVDHMAEKTNPSDYADEVEFILKDLLELQSDKRENIYVMGHSWGGAATLMLAAKGYVNPENTISVCPALLAKKNGWKSFLFDQYRTIRTTYGSLGSLSQLGHTVREIPGAAPVTDVTLNSKLAGEGMKFFIGEYFPGDMTNEQMTDLYNELYPIHSKQMNENLEATAAVMQALNKGIDLYNLRSFGRKLDFVETTKAHINIASCDIVAGSHDKLAPVTETYAQIMSWGQKFKRTNMNFSGLHIINKAGHYAPLYGDLNNDPTMLLMQKAFKITYQEAFGIKDDAVDTIALEETV